VRDLLDGEASEREEGEREDGAKAADEEDSSREGEQGGERERESGGGEEEMETASRNDGSYESPARRAHFFGDSKKERDGGARGIAGERQIERVTVKRKKWVGGDEEAEGRLEGSLSRSPRGPLSLSLSLSSLLPRFLFFSLASLAFFLGEIDQRPRETD